jgi:hypothetical protein
MTQEEVLMAQEEVPKKARESMDEQRIIKVESDSEGETYAS